MKNSKVFYLLVAICIFGLYFYNTLDNQSYSYTITDLPAYNNEEFVYINDNVPVFDSELKTTTSFEIYEELDSLGRAARAFANVSLETMPDGERGSISSIKPTGWHTVKYDNINGKYLYNRCHLIGWQLTSENANPNNIITCTRQMNTGKMLELENMVANYIKETGHHVLYRVTPIYENDNLLATGVQMEGLSVEDNEISFNIFVYNVQDGINIDYKTGESSLK